MFRVGSGLIASMGDMPHRTPPARRGSIRHAPDARKKIRNRYKSSSCNALLHLSPLAIARVVRTAVPSLANHLL
jgi:hypothetical protein